MENIIINIIALIIVSIPLLLVLWLLYILIKHALSDDVSLVAEELCVDSTGENWYGNGEHYQLSVKDGMLKLEKLLGIVKKETILISKAKRVVIELKREYTPAEYETIEKDKSVIGRAIVGGLLLGPVGAIVGGMSGIGTKKETKVIQNANEDIYIDIIAEKQHFLFKVSKLNNDLAYKLYKKVQDEKMTKLIL